MNDDDSFRALPNDLLLLLFQIKHLSLLIIAIIPIIAAMFYDSVAACIGSGSSAGPSCGWRGRGTSRVTFLFYFVAIYLGVVVLVVVVDVSVFFDY